MPMYSFAANHLWQSTLFAGDNLAAAAHMAVEAVCWRRTGIRESLATVGALDLDLTQSIAAGRWRLNRARALEAGILALGQLGALSAPDADAQRAHSKGAGQPMLEEAQPLTQLAHCQRKSYHPARAFPPDLPQIGSDFSRAGISHPIGRNRRLSQAVVGCTHVVGACAHARAHKPGP